MEQSRIQQSFRRLLIQNIILPLILFVDGKTGLRGYTLTGKVEFLDLQLIEKMSFYLSAK